MSKELIVFVGGKTDSITLETLGINLNNISEEF
jgi:hypothetical protein